MSSPASSSPAAGPPDYQSMSPEELISFVNVRLAKTNPTMHFLRGSVLSFDEKTMTVKTSFQSHDQLSNGANQVQGGFSAAMLDATCAYLIMIHSKLTKVISTLEQKQTYLKPVPLNSRLICTAKVLRMGRDVIFFEANLYLDGSDEILVTASQTALLAPLQKRLDKGNKSKM